MKRFLSILLAAMLAVSLFAGFASAEEYDYEEKSLWSLETDNIAWCNYPSMKEHMAAMALPDSTFDIDAYVNSQMGEGVIKLMENVILYREMDQEVLDYWEALGIKKELFNADDVTKKFAVYTPKAVANGEGTYPVVFCLHGGGNPIFAAESYGYAQLGAQENYITVMPENSGIDSVNEIMEFLKENYPVDETRVYSVGLSAGGNASYRNATSKPELFAAITACGQAVLFNGTSDPQTLSALGGVAVYNIVGQFDAFGHYPFTVEGFQSSDVKVAGFNNWLIANNLQFEEVLTKEMITQLYGQSGDVVIANTGVNFPNTYTFEADGAEFWTGEFVNADGINTLRVSMVKNGIHWVTESYAKLSWDFMKNFSRDPETKMLVYANEKK